jgi:hypothetical protein
MISSLTKTVSYGLVLTVLLCSAPDLWARSGNSAAFRRYVQQQQKQQQQMMQMQQKAMMEAMAPVSYTHLTLPTSP